MTSVAELKRCRASQGHQPAEHALDVSVQLRQTDMGFQHIERFEPLSHLIKKWCSPIIALQCFPVLDLPGGGQFDIANTAPNVLSDRYAHPLYALWGLDEVAIAPVILGELHVVVKNELIDSCNNVEVALPRDVVGLQDSDYFHYFDSSRSLSQVISVLCCSIGL